ncbi:glycosyltransferase [Candidatus Profftia sp. (ex Adelges kitamiensis)]|uniref:glycosyltransferase n=1 Tax=Candidatus Profftia sp. (ex Adelges kitamiensis) TaxID=2864218 RepID=UPI001CE3AB94|nr:glycosyltransferase [Candidatus Profftia sp. (ex Adelges kitamiensis)]
MSYKYFNTKDIIISDINFYAKNNIKYNPLHIAYGIDKNFLFGCGVSIASIAIHNKSNNIFYHIFIDSLTQDEKAKIADLSNQFNINISIHFVKCEKIKTFLTTQNWSYAMYLRFIIGDYFIDKASRVLYLDADIICQGDISELSTIDFEDKIVSAVLERDIKWWKFIANSLSCQSLSDGYFNSGFLLIDTNAWYKESVTKKAVSMLEDHSFIKKLTCMDQDVLNLILLNKVKYINSKYNTQLSINDKLKDNFSNPITSNTIFIHYIGPTKPWHSWAQYKISAPFINAKNNSPWRKEDLLTPSNAYYNRYCAKHNFNQGYFFNGIKYYLNYFLLKKITKKNFNINFDKKV